ncbi:Cation channel sperm-associated protein 3 [Amphibalanus amphitrite]|uniref:Cation channel sperm-associated protein 3 n=2 Tax=Amphibalanus amphitrite TaxID=1232801 RepID=A0A6A4WU27_AMPAM|nr:Cation channel sperm-associated protein 3 [Amphibalanus amphitrite]
METLVHRQQSRNYKGSMLNVAFLNPTSSQNEVLVNAPGEGDLTMKSSKLYTRALGRQPSRKLKSKSSGEVDTPVQTRKLSTLPSNVITVRSSIEKRDSSRMMTRWDEDLHKFVCTLTESSRFNGFIMLMIIFNTVVLAVETSPTLRYEYEMALAIVDQSLLAIYTVEAILRIYAEPKNYWLQVSNLFDFLLVVVSLCQPVIEMFVKGAGGVMVFRMFRALKALRTLRSVSFSTNLQVLVSALIDTIRRYVVSVIILLVFIMFLFGVVGYYLFGSNKFAADEAAREDWGTLGRAMLSLFTYVTADGWTAVQDNIDGADMTGKWSRLYTIGFICIGHFIMTNVFIGIIIMNISEATETFRQERRRERELAVRRKKAFMMQRQREDINRMMEKQRRGNWSNFYEMVQSFQESLNHDDYTTVQDMCTNPVWILSLLNTLDLQDQTLENLMNLYFELLHTLAKMSEAEGKSDAKPDP